METFADFFSQHSRRLTTFANIALVILMSVSVANTVLFFVRNMDDSAMGPAVSHNAAPGTRQESLVNLAQLNLFGKAGQAAPTTVDAPETSLNLELQGVFTAANPKMSTAIIAEGNKSGKLYQIGDRLPGNAVLQAVYDDHILIKRGARLEKLMFSNAKSSNQQAAGLRHTINPGIFHPPSSSNEGVSPNRLQDLRRRIEERRRQIAEQRAREQANSPGATIRDYVEHFHKQIESNPKAVLNRLGVSPVSAGQPDGYRIGNNVPQQMLAQAGLQQGDVVLSVNGTPVGDVQRDSSLVNQVLASGRARVEIQRGSRKFFLTVPIPKSR